MTAIDTAHEAALPFDASDEQRRAPDDLSVAEVHALEWDGDGRFRDSDEPENIVHDNTRRAGFATEALRGYTDMVGGRDNPAQQVISDLLGDLMHLADALRMDFDYLVEQAARHYEPETRGER